LYQQLAAAVDNVIGIRTRADIQEVRRLAAGTTSMDQLLGTGAAWTARHRDELWRTFVQSRVIKNGVEQMYYWEVDRGVSPMRNYERTDGVFVTPLTRATAALTPTLLPVAVSNQLPEGPGTNAAFLYQAAGIAPRLASLPPFVRATREPKSVPRPD
jgi:hypothetical protein